jgi:hypothetical protein
MPLKMDGVLLKNITNSPIRPTIALMKLKIFE